jgi:hypothetical protein
MKSMQTITMCVLSSFIFGSGGHQEPGRSFHKRIDSSGHSPLALSCPASSKNLSADMSEVISQFRDDDMLLDLSIPEGGAGHLLVRILAADSTAQKETLYCNSHAA